MLRGRPRERENVAVALGPLALRRRERRDAVELVEVLVGVEVVAKGHALLLVYAAP